MTDSGRAVAEAAARLVGTPFLLHGRDPQTGLDCVGLVASALSASSREPVPPRTYGLRNSEIRTMLGCAELSGLRPATGSPRPGDILLVQPGPAQNHLLVIGPDGCLIHAHAGLRRVVSMPGTCPWPVLKHWHPPL